MNENLPEFIGNIPIKTEQSPEKTHILPPYKLELFKEKIVGLDIDDKSQMDNINIWWRTIDRSAAWVKRANLALVTEGLPKQEKMDAESGLGDVDSTFKGINSSLNDLLTSKPTKIEKNVKSYVNSFTSFTEEFFGSSKNKEAQKVESLNDEILKFNRGVQNPLTGQVIAFCEVFGETQNLNDTKTMRMKIAQWAFEEMVALFPRIEMFHKYEGIPEPTTVDDIDEEKSELLSALNGDVWTSEEIEKWKNVYKQNRQAMGKFRFEEPVKKSFEFIFRSALGKTSAKYSAIQILIEAENVFQGIKDDDTLREAWDYEAEQEDGVEQ